MDPHRGIRNRRNTCYIACALQAIMASPSALDALAQHNCRNLLDCCACVTIQTVVETPIDVEALQETAAFRRAFPVRGGQHDAGNAFDVIMQEANLEHHQLTIGSGDFPRSAEAAVEGMEGIDRRSAVIVNIARFGGLRKDNGAYGVPPTLQIGGESLQLTAIMEHHGLRADAGHWTCWANRSGQWTFYDDNVVDDDRQRPTQRDRQRWRKTAAVLLYDIRQFPPLDQPNPQPIQHAFPLPDRLTSTVPPLSTKTHTPTPTETTQTRPNHREPRSRVRKEQNVCLKYFS
jgi:hypothetical protein